MLATELLHVFRAHAALPRVLDLVKTMDKRVMEQCGFKPVYKDDYPACLRRLHFFLAYIAYETDGLRQLSDPTSIGFRADILVALAAWHRNNLNALADRNDFTALIEHAGGEEDVEGRLRWLQEIKRWVKTI